MSIKQFFHDLRWAPKIIKKLSYLPWAIVDPKWFWFLQLMLENANVPEKYRYMFIPDKEGSVFVDCGMNVGLITDIARFMNMKVYWFEPNPQAIKLLNKKYLNDDNVIIYPNAVSNSNGKMNFFINGKWLFDDGATLIREWAELLWDKTCNVTVDVLRLVDVIKNDILSKHKFIHLLKIDIEWAEFGVLDDIIDENIYGFCNYIAVETHERFFEDWKEKLEKIQRKIKENNINNIYLDWI